MSTHDVGLVSDPAFLQHESPPGHPERPQRLPACTEALEQAGLLARLTEVPARPVTTAEAAQVHAAAYLDRLDQCRGQSGQLDPDTFYSPHSQQAAALAAGGGVDLVRGVLADELGAGLALVRPPGHHATRAGAMGSCLLNNLAVAAAAVLQEQQRVAVVDFDVHHGNGTQWAFYEDPRVLVISIHGLGPGFYPGSGQASERGQGKGAGMNLNLPLPEGSADQAYRAAIDGPAQQAMTRFAPDILLLSAGFDAHQDDPIGGMNLTDGGFGHLLQQAAGWSRQHCQGRCVAVLEGGYQLEALARGTVALARCLLAG